MKGLNCLGDLKDKLKTAGFEIFDYVGWYVDTAHGRWTMAFGETFLNGKSIKDMSEAVVPEVKKVKEKIKKAVTEKIEKTVSKAPVKKKVVKKPTAKKTAAVKKPVAKKPVAKKKPAAKTKTKKMVKS